jgi:hypothetical protein
MQKSNSSEITSTPATTPQTGDTLIGTNLLKKNDPEQVTGVYKGSSTPLLPNNRLFDMAVASIGTLILIVGGFFVYQLREPLIRLQEKFEVLRRDLDINTTEIKEIKKEVFLQNQNTFTKQINFTPVPETKKAD